MCLKIDVPQEQRPNGLQRSQPYDEWEAVLLTKKSTKINIPVYKVVMCDEYGRITGGPYYKYDYEMILTHTIEDFGVHYSLATNSLLISEAFHSCKTLAAAYQYVRNLVGPMIREGQPRIVEAVIPAGSCYFETEKYYASGQIIIGTHFYL